MLRTIQAHGLAGRDMRHRAISSQFGGDLAPKETSDDELAQHLVERAQAGFDMAWRNYCDQHFGRSSCTAGHRLTRGSIRIVRGGYECKRCRRIEHNTSKAYISETGIAKTGTGPKRARRG